ncbi:MAG: hypothetical protein QM831_02760 [Kofleriaceae bacterium]
MSATVASADPCAVHIVDAPDAVRAEIEHWVAAEPRCARELTVRVTETADGLLVEADGRQRVLPDARSVAVLVVSWMADDTIGRAPVVEPVRPPSTVEPTRVVARVEPPAASSNRWLAVGAVIDDAGIGVDGRLDVVTRARWTLGLELSWQPTDHEKVATSTAGLAFVSFTRAVSRIELRAQLGVGVGLREERHDEMKTSSAAPLARASVVARLPYNAWAGFAGPVVSVDDRAVSIAGVLGLERRW